MNDHTGRGIAKAVYAILDDYNLIGKIGFFTVDNASNNIKFFEEFDIQLENNGYTFSVVNKQIRCFCHVMHLVVTTFFDNLKENSKTPPEKFTCYRTNSSRRTVKNNQECHSILEKIRGIVRCIRSSSQQTEIWNELCIQSKVKVKKLPTDCPTRWSSAYQMLSTVHQYKDQFNLYCTMSKKTKNIVNANEWGMVEKILDLLKIFSDFTAFSQSECFPTIYFSVDAYNQLFDALDNLDQEDLPIANSLDHGYALLRKYYAITDCSPVHLLLCPRIKWIIFTSMILKKRKFVT